jgi:argininosuccinate synthase
MKIVLAYSGGLDTSVIRQWLKETYRADIIAFAADVGQAEELKGLKKKALATGACKVYVDDLQEEFARDFIFPMLRANAIYEGQYFLGTAIARPLIAKRMVEIAEQEGADAIAHGATGKGNDQVRFELSAAALNPAIEVIAPWRIEAYRNQFPGRAEMIAYCAQHRINVQASAKKPYSMDRNLLHISYEAGILEDPWFDAFAPKNKDMFRLTRDPADAPDRPETVELEYRRGDCVAVNGRKLSPLEVMRKLNALAGRHGVGRVDMVENRFVGMKSRGSMKPRRHDPAVCPPPDGIHHHGPRNHAPARQPDPALRRDGLQRLLVLARTPRPAGPGRGNPGQRHRHRSRQALQGRPLCRRPEEPRVALQPADRHHGCRSHQGLRPERCHRFYPSQCPPSQGGRSGPWPGLRRRPPAPSGRKDRP